MTHSWKVLSAVVLNMAFAVALMSCGGGGGGSTVIQSPGNNAPTADAGPNRSVLIGSLVTLDGSGSTDIEGSALTYSWSFTMRPTGSIAALVSATSVTPRFTADLDGSYVVRLVVNDGMAAGFADSVTITTTTTPANSAPVANAGPDQNVKTGATVTLNGNGSTDADLDALTYSWSLIVPGGSSAALSSSTAISPTFFADVEGSYVAQLIVNDGTVNSPADSVTTTVTPSIVNSAPVANAGSSQSVFPNDLVTLDGSGSSDADGNSLTYGWSFTSKPIGSLASLSTGTAVNPTFIADLEGTYVVQLIVNDSAAASTAHFVTIRATRWSWISIIDAPAGRAFHTAVWTGTEMIVWGGGTGATTRFNTGGLYDPAANLWTATSTTGAPSERILHTAVWTGSKMIVWGGWDGTTRLNTGGIYDPNTNIWTAMSTTNAPTGRYYHTAVWTGSTMIVWGGESDTGGVYNPADDTWTATSTANAPTGRYEHSAVWTGSEMIVWGGGVVTAVNNGGKYNPVTNTWTPTNTIGAPSGRLLHTAVWTGTEMIVWGGWDGTSRFVTGGKYDPGADTWTATNTAGAPTERFYHTAVWTGTEMMVWGGVDGGEVYPGIGGRYEPGANTWTATSAAPLGKFEHTAVWTGTEMIVWGGWPYNYANTGEKYTP